MLDIRQSDEWASYLKSIGWNVDNVNGTYIYSKKVPILGSVTKIQRAGKGLDLEKLEKILKKRRTFGVYVEPVNLSERGYYVSNGFRDGKPSLPSKTIIFDLRKTQKELLSEMHYKVRYNIRLAKRKGVEVIESDDIELFSDIWHKAARKRKMFLSQKKEIMAMREAFHGRSNLLLGYFSKVLLSGIMIVSSNTTTHYMYAGSTEMGKKLHAPTLMVWESIIAAKRFGSKIFDFEGIYDERFPLNDWKGFTRFKKSFGGHEIEYPIPLRKYSSPF